MEKKSVYERKEREEDIYSFWLRNANERQVLEKALDDRFREWYKKTDSSPLRIIDMGCGRGSAAIKLLNILKRRGISYQYTGIDPSPNQISMFKVNMRGRPNVRAYCSTLEEFTSKDSFDIAFVVHSLYYVQNMTESLKQILALSKNAIIVHHGERGINEVHKRFKPHVRKGPHIISTHEDVTKALDKLEIRYAKRVYPTKTKTASCNDPKNSEGRNMIKFFLEQPTLPESTIEQVSKYFAKRKLDYLTHDMGLIITK
ncbi:methyltransferase domain-containing protein [Candidatus Pacearchaeota archaeon]|nr:methyltransferase domain-containing protein [Candidatus Pacearchaeota archaeon]